jgi:hypothetical protein
LGEGILAGAAARPTLRHSTPFAVPIRRGWRERKYVQRLAAHGFLAGERLAVATQVTVPIGIIHLVAIVLAA